MVSRPRRASTTGEETEKALVVAGGKDNTITEFRELARRAGLAVVAAGLQASRSFVVECRP